MQASVDTSDTIASAPRSRRPIRIADVARDGKSARRPRPHQSDLAPSTIALQEVMLLSTDGILEADPATVACSLAAPFVLGSEQVSRSPTCEVSIASDARNDQVPQEDTTPTRLKRQSRRSSRAIGAPSTGRGKRRIASLRAGDMPNTLLQVDENESVHMSCSGREAHNDVSQSWHREQRQYGNAFCNEGSTDLEARSEINLTDLADEEKVTIMCSPTSGPLETIAVSSLSRSSRDRGLVSSNASSLRFLPASHLSLASQSDSIGLASLNYADLRHVFVRLLEQLLEQRIVEESFRNDHDTWQMPTIPPASELARDALPNVVVTKEDLMDDTTSRCPICFERYCPGTRATRMFCGHLFCTGCIWEWLNTANTCPVCRYELPTNNPDFEVARLERMRCRRACLKEGDLNLMSVHRLKQLMLILSVGSEGCSEKGALISRLRADTKIEIRSDRINLCYDEADLSTLDLCALRSLMKRHNVLPPCVELGDTEARIECLKRLELAGFMNTNASRASVDGSSEPRKRRGNDKRSSGKDRAERPRTSANARNLPCRKSSRVQIAKSHASISPLVGDPLTNSWDESLASSLSQGKRFADLVLESSPKVSCDGIRPSKVPQPKHVGVGPCAHGPRRFSQRTLNRIPASLEHISANSGAEDPLHATTCSATSPLDDNLRASAGNVACGSPASIGDITPSACTHFFEVGENAATRLPDRSTEANRTASLMRCCCSFLSCMLKSNRQTSS